MALTPTNVLVSDPAAEWMKLAVPVVLQQDLLPTRFTVPLLAASETNLGDIGAQDILRTKIEDHQGKLHIEATIVDAATQKTTSTENEEASSAATLIPALDALAKRIDSDAERFSTRNTEALKSLRARLNSAIRRSAGSYCKTRSQPTRTSGWPTFCCSK